MARKTEYAREDSKDERKPREKPQVVASSGAEGGANADRDRLLAKIEDDADLQRLIAMWPSLPANIIERIMRLVNEATG